MHALTSWFIRNPVAANLVMALILIWGAMSLWGIRIEGFPRVPPDTVSVSVVYPGATAEQVDRSITSLIEQSLSGVPGSKLVTSYATNSYGVVRVKAKPGYSVDRLIEDIRMRADSINNLPNAAEKLQIVRDEFDFPAMIVQIYGDTDPRTLQKLGRLLKKELMGEPEISQIKSWGERQLTLSVFPDARKMEAYQLTYNDFADQIRQDSFLYRTGELKLNGTSLELRADKRLDAEDQIRQIVILQSPDGGQVKLGDIAQVKRSFADEEFEVLFQGLPTLGYEIQIGKSDNILDVRKAVDRVLKRQRELLPENVHIEVWADQSSYISERLALLRSNAFQGLIIVLVLLSIFLSPKLAFWVSLGIPISLAGAVGVMRMSGFDYSLNDVTTFGMIIALGILVDDAIVVGESVYQARTEGKDPLKQTEIGVKRVAVATIFGVMTTIAAFAPMLAIQDPLGKTLAGFAAVVIFALLFSLFESKFILPSHLAHARIENEKHNNFVSRIWSALQTGVSNGLDITREKIYLPILRASLKFRYSTLMVFVAIAFAMFGLMKNGHIRTTFFPDVPGNYIAVNVEMQKGVPFSHTLQAAKKIENTYHEINSGFASIGLNPTKPGTKLMTAVLGANSIQMYAELVHENDRNVDTLDFLAAWRDKLDAPEGIESISFSATDNIGGGFIIELTSNDDKALVDASDKLESTLQNIVGVSNVRDNLAEGNSQLRLDLNEQGKLLGLTTADIAMLVGDQFGALEVDRFLREGEEMKLILKRSDEELNSMEDLLSSKVRLPSGELVTLSAIADMNYVRVVDELQRRNLKRAALILAKVDKSLNTAPSVFEELKLVIQELETQWPELKIRGLGELQQEEEMGRDLSKAFIIALVIMYVCLAIPLKSYFQPIIIMLVIPFGVVGAALGHMLLEIPLSMLSFFGILALSGIVVNDSLVLMTTFNALRRDGMHYMQAITEAAGSRMRAVFLTTITTVAGLAPIMFETSEQAQYLIPAAVSLAFGELFATAITLVLVPILCSIVFDFKEQGKKHGPLDKSLSSPIPELISTHSS